MTRMMQGCVLPLEIGDAGTTSLEGCAFCAVSGAGTAASLIFCRIAPAGADTLVQPDVCKHGVPCEDNGDIRREWGLTRGSFMIK